MMIDGLEILMVLEPLDLGYAPKSRNVSDLAGAYVDLGTEEYSCGK